MSDDNTSPDTGEKREIIPVFRVVVFAAPSEPEALSKILQETLGLHPIDSRIHAHAVPGILPDRLPEDQAQRVAREIGTLGITTEVIAEEELPHLEHPEVVHHALIDDSDLKVLEYRGREERTIPWTEIELISVGYVPLEKTVHIPVDTTVILSAAPRAPTFSYEFPTFSGPEAWLVTTGEPQAYRINHNEMNYETLGDRRTDSATVNFRLLLGDFMDHLPNIYVPPATHAFLRGGLLRHYLFQSSEELQRYTRFHLLLLHRLRSNETA